MEPIKLSVFTFPQECKTYFECVDYAKDAGAQAIELFPTRELATPDVAAARRIREYANQQGLDISCFSIGVSLHREDQPQQVERLLRYAEVAAAAGSPWLHHTLALPCAFPMLETPFAEMLKRVVPAAQQVFDGAAQLGVRCIYEDQGFVFNGAQRVEWFLDALERDAGLVLDMGNSLFVGEPPEIFASRFGSRIVHVHAKDYLRKTGLRPSEDFIPAADGAFLCDTIVGHGAVDVMRVMSILCQAGYTGYYSTEVDVRDNRARATKVSLDNLKRYYRIVTESL